MSSFALGALAFAVRSSAVLQGQAIPPLSTEAAIVLGIAVALAAVIASRLLRR
jgi:hypothetical protein